LREAVENLVRALRPSTPTARLSSRFFHLDSPVNRPFAHPARRCWALGELRHHAEGAAARQLFRLCDDFISKVAELTPRGGDVEQAPLYAMQVRLVRNEIAPRLVNGLRKHL
jgi:hypothetical protein